MQNQRAVVKKGTDLSDKSEVLRDLMLARNLTTVMQDTMGQCDGNVDAPIALAS